MTTRRTDLPPSASVRMFCPTCNREVRLHIAREFVRAIEQVCMVAGVNIPGDIPALTYGCEGGHIIIIPVERFGLAS